MFTNRSSSPYNVRNMPGHGFFSTRKPSSPSGTSSPASLRMAASCPKNGLPADPGFCGSPGTWVIWNMPVSVCHQVSITGQRSLPITR